MPMHVSGTGSSAANVLVASGPASDQVQAMDPFDRDQRVLNRTPLDDGNIPSGAFSGDAERMRLDADIIGVLGFRAPLPGRLHTCSRRATDT
jgi:hypothetical protein